MTRDVALGIIALLTLSATLVWLMQRENALHNLKQPHHQHDYAIGTTVRN